MDESLRGVPMKRVGISEFRQTVGGDALKTTCFVIEDYRKPIAVTIPYEVYIALQVAYADYQAALGTT